MKINSPDLLSESNIGFTAQIKSKGIFLDYLELTKPRPTLMALATTAVGFYMGSRDSLNLTQLIQTLWGSWLVGAGSTTLNQFMEHDIDGLMRRTKARPLPSGRLTDSQALTFGVTLLGLGILTLALFVNLLTSLIGLVLVVSYLLLYTPLKRKTPFCVLVGALPGALPPVMGWSGASGSLSVSTGVLFCILFLWQLPHFFAIAWIWKEDYSRAGLPMFTVLDAEDDNTVRRIIFYCLILLPVSLIPSWIGMTGVLYLRAAFLLGLLFLGMGIYVGYSRLISDVKKFAFLSIIYLAVLMLLMSINKI